MSPRKSAGPAAGPDAIAKLIRERRSLRGWSLAKLATAAGIRSPSYIFHIENGNKLPSEAVAARLAVALGLDPDLLAAWARARGRAGLRAVLDASDTVRNWIGDSSDSAREAGDAPGAGRFPMDPETLLIPVLPEGADPEAGAAPIETLRLARALLPPLEPDSRLIAYRLSAHGARPMPDVLRAGDFVVVCLGNEPPGPETPCALRASGRIEIARAPAREAAAHLPPAPDRPDHGGLDSGVDASTGRVVVGRVVLAVRRWL